jgi:hemolysin D
VQELTVNTVGGVVTDAQQLMLIVPDEVQLEVEVFLENKDIGFVEEGMPAEIKVHTFPFTKYGLIGGEVTMISDDATVDEQRGLIYGMQLAMAKNTIGVNGKSVKLMPGMAVTAEVQTGKRRVIEFFMAPLLRHKQESIRER